MVINGTGELLQSPVSRLQEIGVIQKKRGFDGIGSDCHHDLFAHLIGVSLGK
jgi:hypothetical protein